MFLRLLLVLLILGGLLGGLYWLKTEQQGASGGMMGPPPATVAVMSVNVVSWQPSLRTVGSLKSVQGVQVSSEVAGQIRSIHFDSDQPVTTGDLLVQLDDSVDRADLEGLLARSKLARVKLERFQRLRKDRAASQSELDEASAELDGAEAAVRAKEALIRKKRITAPFDGRLGIRAVDLGEYLAAGSKIVRLESLDPIFVDFSLPERHLSEISRDQAISVTVAAWPDKRFDGRISAISPGVDEQTRSMRLRAILSNPDGLLRPGMFAEVAVALPERSGVRVAPRVAIDFAPYGNGLFVIVEGEKGMTVSRRLVETGELRDGQVEIVEGVEPGERVVVAGLNKLRNGQAVVIDNSLLPDETGPLEP